MSTLSHYLLVFAFGGALCVPAQILIDKTRLTPARILVIYVVVGVLLGGVGLYEPLVGLFGSGARVPLTGFGYALAKGVKEAVEKSGLLGALYGGFTAMSAGVCAAIVFGLLAALCFRSKRI